MKTSEVNIPICRLGRPDIHFFALPLIGVQASRISKLWPSKQKRSGNSDSMGKDKIVLELKRLVYK